MLKGECHIKFGTNLGKVVVYFLTIPTSSVAFSLFRLPSNRGEGATLKTSNGPRSI